MTLKERIRQKILNFLNLDSNPNSDRYSFISNEENIKEQKLMENKVWYYGDSNELLNFYTNEQIYGNAREPIYNRNKRNYFWGLSSTETDIKRVHSGIPNAIVNTIVNIIGVPHYNFEKEENYKTLEEILEENDFNRILNQQQIPLTLVEGWGAFKINIDKDVSKNPIIQYYEGEDVDFIYKSKRLIGITFKDYYQYKEKDYVLIETRRLEGKDSIIEYELFKLEKNNEVVKVELSTIPDLSHLEDSIIKDYNKILAVPSVFFYDLLDKNYGRSIFSGKIDLFDDLDQILSQDSQTVRVSTPVEYYPVDVLERNSDGQPKMPKIYNRQFVKLESLPNGDGDVNQNIVTTQPQLNFEQYSANAKSKLDFILTGLLSPATLGIDIAKKDNADAQREKEKITIMTRNNIIDRQERILKQLFSLCLDVKQYLDTGTMPKDQNYEISIKFDEFANPSFESELEILGNAWTVGSISTDKYVELLWKDSISEEEKTKEKQWLDERREKESVNYEDDEDSPTDEEVEEKPKEDKK